jgi:hypothetical protein
MRTLAFVAVFAALTAACAAAQGPRKLNPRLVNIQPNRWLKLHEQKKSDAVVFRRQAHGGSCFDTKRGRLILFGSDTHGRSWVNSPVFFDPVACTWSRAYPDDKPDTYRVDASGIPVAGPSGEHPWTMHTFGGVLYDPARDEMVVVSHPGHMVPGRFTNRTATWSSATGRTASTSWPAGPASGGRSRAPACSAGTTTARTTRSTRP